MHHILIMILASTLVACGGAERRERSGGARVPGPLPLGEGESHRIVTFVGEPFSRAIPGAAPLVISPAPPRGVVFDAQTGRVSGSLAVPGALTFHITDQARRDRVVSIEAVAAPDARARFVAATGDDGARGTRDQPFRSVRRALDGVAPGTVIFLDTGRYQEDVAIHGVRGEAGAPIVLRSLPGARVILEGSQPSLTWERATGPAAASHEWVSRESFERAGQVATNRGAFVAQVPFTRLLTYSRVEDLRAENQRFDLNNPDVPGVSTPKGHHMPWTYFGPGLWHDPETNKIHLRLAPTAHGVRDLAEYDGPTDPAAVEISVWARSSTPLSILRSAHIEIRDLTVVGGGDETVSITKSEQITLDHVDVHAATMGLVIGASSGVRFRHGRIDGGIPPWTFRSDFKASYKIAMPDGSRVENNLVRKTSRALVYVGGGCRDLELSHCELENAHDIYMAGVRSSIHHCRIRNIHDEALFVSHVREIDDLRIHDNVFERVLSAVSGVGRKTSGPRYIYRNLFDLRDPTAGYRPGASPRQLVWRWGHMFKGVIGAAPFYFYQNTIAVRSNKPGQPALLHYHALEPTPRHPNWFANNVVLVAGEDPGPFAFVPDPEYQATGAGGRPHILSDGNTWIRPGGDRRPAFRCKSPRKGGGCATKRWRTLEAVRTTGLESRSRIITRPMFARMESVESVTRGDDLRPLPGSPAVGTAIPLPSDLPDSVPATERRDAGALPLHAPALQVGIDGRWSY